MVRSRQEQANIVFMVVWLVVWTSAIIIAVWAMGGTVLHGDFGAALVLAVWLAAAGFGLWSGARKLLRLLIIGRDPAKPARNHRWVDGIEPPPR